MDKVHLVAGPNNSGKSNILRVAQQVLPSLAGKATLAIKEADRPVHADADARTLRVAVARAVRDDDKATLGGGNSAALDLELLHVVLRDATEDERGEYYWFEYQHQDGRWVLAEDQIQRLIAATSEVAGTVVVPLGGLSTALTNFAADTHTNAERVLEACADRLGVTSGLPTVATIPAFREISEGSGDVIQDGHHGPGLIERLAELQNPSAFDATAQQERFARITAFVATLFDDAEARIEIPHDRSTIFIHHQGRRLPLENYGTGVHEVVILAAAATVLSMHLVCIEEPEIHLHPTLQRKLLGYLKESTDNQYLIATHSAHLLDAAKASISAVSLVDGRTRVAPAIAPGEIAALSAELGLRASDLVQANAIIWVEGPSDRTYLRHWLREIASDMIEGIHFSIMFYGGSLLAELSPEDPSVHEFISLPRINRNFSIVIDSDRRSEEANINATKTRVRDSFAAQDVRGEIWVTAGYTIENYVPSELLVAAVEATHPTARLTWAGEQFENPLATTNVVDRASPVDKAAIAREVVERWDASTVWPLDLRERVEALAEAIRAVNVG